MNGADPETIRVRYVTSESAEIRIDEWDYLDGKHVLETIDYMVIEAGIYDFDGLLIGAGEVTNNHLWQSHEFSADFINTPVVMTQLASANGGDAAGTSLKDLTADEFTLQLEEQESKWWHVDEAVHYLAIEGNGEILLESDNTLLLGSGSTGRTVDHHFTEISFLMNNPGLLANMQTTYGGNTATLRYQDLTSNGVEIKVSEERSFDLETWHTMEEVGFVLFSETLAVSPESLNAAATTQIIGSSSSSQLGLDLLV